MNLNKPSLIGIKGFKGSGKDTVASMISYILYVGTTKANFDSWHVQHQADIISNSEIIIHFADKLKNDITDLCGINRCLLDNRLIKETHYYNFATGIVSMNTKDSYHVIDEVPTNLSHLLALMVIMLVLKFVPFFNIMVLKLLEISFGKKLLFVIQLIKHLVLYIKRDVV